MQKNNKKSFQQSTAYKMYMLTKSKINDNPNLFEYIYVDICDRMKRYCQSNISLVHVEKYLLQVCSIYLQKKLEKQQTFHYFQSHCFLILFILWSY